MDDLMNKVQELLSDEESVKQLNELASSLFSSLEQEENTAGQNDGGGSLFGSDFDLGKIFTIGQLINSASDDKNTGLILALRPLLSEKRREKADKAVKILKLLAVWELLKENGMLDDLF